MDAFILYLAKASGLVALFYTAYYLLLKKETFFTPNRWFLIAGLITSAVLPLAEYTKVIWVTAKPVVPLYAADLQMLMQYATTIKQQQPQITLNDILLGIYCAGVLLFFARFVNDVSFIRDIIKANKAVKNGKFKLIDSPQAASPFSFFNYIAYNSVILQPEELENILEHEKVHSTQRHSVDMILGQLFCVLFWFNPFVWLYKKAMAQNLEFIADAGATSNVQDVVAYQKTLLKITMQPECIAITNHFYQSLIKKRIIMLNKEKSKARSYWKYAAMLPVLAIFILAFQVKVVAQEKTTAPHNQNLVIVQEITKDTKDKELEESRDLFKQEFDADVTVSGVSRNTKSEITAITVNVALETEQRKYEVKGSQPIETFKIILERDEEGIVNVNIGTPAAIKQHLAAIALPEDAEIAEDVEITDTIAYNGGKWAIQAPPAAAYGMSTPGGNVALNLGNTEVLVVVNGIKYLPGQQIKLPAGQQITSITTLTGKEGKSKYGKEGKKGAIEVTSSAGAYGFVMPNNGDFDYDFSLNGGPESFEFKWENFSTDDMAFVMKQLNELKERQPFDEISKSEMMERAQIILDDLKNNGVNGDKDEIETTSILRERDKAALEKRRAEVEKKRAELEKKREESFKNREDSRRAADKERAKAAEIKNAAKQRQ